MALYLPLIQPNNSLCSLSSVPEITSSDEPDGLLLMQKICNMVGRPRNYNPSSQEMKEEEKRKADDKMRRESRVRALEEQSEVEEAKHRAARWEEWVGA